MENPEYGANEALFLLQLCESEYFWRGKDAGEPLYTQFLPAKLLEVCIRPITVTPKLSC